MSTQTILYDDLDWLPEPDRTMIRTAMDAMNELHLWGWITSMSAPSGFIHATNPEVIQILQHIEHNRRCPWRNGYDGHSGASFGCTMQTMRRIAQVGFDAWKAHHHDDVSRQPDPRRTVSLAQ